MAPRYVSTVSANQIYKIPDGSPILRYLDPKHADATAGHDGTLGNDTIYGTFGNDVIYGDGGFDKISSGMGNDRITLGSNAGREVADAFTAVEAGWGNDYIAIPKGAHGTFGIDTGVGNDYVKISGGNLIALDATKNALDSGDAFHFTDDFRGDAWILNYDNASDTLLLEGDWHVDPNNSLLFSNDNGGAVVVITHEAGPVANVRFWDLDGIG